MTKHVFALYVSHLVVRKQNVLITDDALLKRITHVLRLQPGEQITLFDTHSAYASVIQEISKKQVILRVTDKQQVLPVKPEITLLLPLLERDALEEVMYMATIYGVQTIQLMVTHKSRKSATEKDVQRLRNIAIAAAEQSKQFCLPDIVSPVTLEKSLTLISSESTRIWCDIGGAKILDYLATAASTGFTCILGPEGDFTPEEKELVSMHFKAVKLTPHVLRARDAASLVLGVLRLG